MKPNVSSSPAKPSTEKRIVDTKHKLCLHNHGCLKYSLQVAFHNYRYQYPNLIDWFQFFIVKVLAQRFLYGWGLHACVSIVLSIPQIIRKPSNFLILLRKEKHLRFGAFLASLVTVNQVCGSLKFVYAVYTTLETL